MASVAKNPAAGAGADSGDLEDGKGSGAGSAAVPCVDNVSFLSRVTVTWLTPLITLSRRRPIYPSDLPPCAPGLTSDVLRTAFNVEWTKELAKPRPSLFRAIVRTFYRNIKNGGMWMGAFAAAQISMPFFIKVCGSTALCVPVEPLARCTPRGTRLCGGTRDAWLALAVCVCVRACVVCVSVPAVHVCVCDVGEV
jgi:hypothetical protein